MIKKLNQTVKIQILLILVLLVIFIFKINGLPPQVPLFYSKPEGDDQIVDSFMMFLLPFFSFLFVIVNNFIFIKYFSENKLVATVIYYVNMLVILLTSFIFLRILFLIT